jgi:hypothetical protein
MYRHKRTLASVRAIIQSFKNKKLFLKMLIIIIIYNLLFYTSPPYPSPSGERQGDEVLFRNHLIRLRFQPFMFVFEKPFLKDKNGYHTGGDR